MLPNKERFLLQESAEKNILKYVVNISPLLDNVLHSHDLRIYGFEYTSNLSRIPRVYPCKFFLASVNFYRFNAQNWHFRQIVSEKVAFLAVQDSSIGDIVTQSLIKTDF